ncbi:ribonuclease H [Aspergillus sclerotialis]|uniref:ribonuclease H n=1 Tax=Aspergillus sclerotialis TaxID=2070753 RepID=A0A3A2ZH32_9EURO|nr:ribonuclease H [Aspergillus sclerotialis]
MHGATPSSSPAPAAKPSLDINPSPAISAGAKRKRSSVGKYYAVKRGFQPGIYYEWNDCLAQVTGYKGGVFQAFSNFEDANAFLTGVKPPSGRGQTPQNSTPSRFYGIQRGRVPGVYTDWAQAQEQIRGFTRPRYKKFSTREEAEEFVRMGQDPTAVEGGSTLKIDEAPGMISEGVRDEHGTQIEPGDGPLPPGAVDGFDPNLLLDPVTGKVVHKTKEQKTATKPKPTGPPGMLRIYTDGSSLKNGGTLASAGVGVYFGPGDTSNPSRNVSEPLRGNRQTNQRAELTAILRALDIAPRHRDITIVTDSQYAINCVTVWFISWRRNNWMTSSKKPVENRDLVESILDKIEERESLKVKTLFEWVKGHNMDTGNEEADRLAVNGAHIGESEKKAVLDQDIPDEVFKEDF